MSIAEPLSLLDYPSSDGLPMAETSVHIQAIMWLHQALEDFFGPESENCVASDLFWYWQEGNVNARVAPDVMVIPGVGVRERRSYFAWEEGGTVPAVVFEMASRGTVDEDLTTKFFQYEDLGVREYFLFDPEGTNMTPLFQGYRLNGTAYRRLRGEQLDSELGFGLRAEGQMLRLIDLRTGQPVPTRAEAVERERKRADGLQAEVDRLRALLAQQGAPGNGS